MPNSLPLVTCNSRIAFSCVVDTQIRFHRQALLWYHGLRQFLGIAPKDIFVHYITGCDPDLLSYFAAQGVCTIEIKVFDQRSLPLNKLGQLKTIELAQYDYVVLSDCDKVYFPLFLQVFTGKSIRACGFIARPPMRVMESLYQARGLALGRVVPRPKASDSENDARSLWNNVNGGTYVIPKESWNIVVERWSEFSGWIMTNHEKMERWLRNADQVAFCMALDQEGLEVDLLPMLHDIGANAPGIKGVSGNDKIGAIHYHDQVDANGRLVAGTKAHPTVKNYIDKINQLIDNLPVQAARLYENYCAFEREKWDSMVELNKKIGLPLRPLVSPCRNSLEINMFGLQRSGNHAVIVWLLQQFKTPQVFLNNISPHFTDPFLNFHHESVPNAVAINRIRHQGAEALEELRAREKQLLLVSYENLSLPILAQKDCIPEHEITVGSSGARIPILLVRDYFNWISSRLRLISNKKLPAKNPAETVMGLTHQWCEYAKELHGQTNFLGAGAVRISFTAWTVDPNYRLGVLEQLGLPCLNNDNSVVPGVGGGSSFDKTNFSGAAGKMAVHARSDLLDDSTRNYIDAALRRYPETLRLNAELFNMEKPW